MPGAPWEESAPSAPPAPPAVSTAPASPAVSNAAVGEHAPRLLLLVDEAQRAEGEARRAAAGRINRLLDGMAQGEGSREVADVYLRLLEGGGLRELEDGQGRNCHRAAVEGLLALGFPYALEVSPEDLEFLHHLPEVKEAAARGEASPPSKVAPTAVLLVGILLQSLGAALTGPGGGPRLGELAPFIALDVLALVAALLAPAGSLLHRMSYLLLGVVSLLVVALSLGAGLGGLVVGLAGLLAAFLFAKH